MSVLGVYAVLAGMMSYLPGVCHAQRLGPVVSAVLLLLAAAPLASVGLICKPHICCLPCLGFVSPGSPWGLCCHPEAFLKLPLATSSPTTLAAALMGCAQLGALTAPIHVCSLYHSCFTPFYHPRKKTYPLTSALTFLLLPQLQILACTVTCSA